MVIRGLSQKMLTPETNQEDGPLASYLLVLTLSTFVINRYYFGFMEHSKLPKILYTVLSFPFDLNH